ncbi:uncharacterized protein [Amphiura filiformis]|uniref:uncharacterized protein n=1 Tax=Amphiura filiformis TaxID=82378 RepID=UPI003B21C965
MDTLNCGQQKCYKILRSRRISTTEQETRNLLERDLIAAVKEGNIDEVRTLIQLGGDVNTTEDGCSLLMLAIMYGHSFIAQLLVNTGADVTYPIFKISGDGEVRKTALDYAAEHNMDCVHELIERRMLANKNIQMAVEDGNSRLTKSLLEQDADINTPVCIT